MHSFTIHLLLPAVNCFLQICKVWYHYWIEQTFSQWSYTGVLQEDGTTIMFDPQYCTHSGNAAPWDYGKHCITPFVKKHQCSKYCTYLDLPPIVPERPKPRPIKPCSEPLFLGDDEDAGSNKSLPLPESASKEHEVARHSSAWCTSFFSKILGPNFLLLSFSSCFYKSQLIALRRL